MGWDLLLFPAGMCAISPQRKDFEGKHGSMKRHFGLLLPDVSGSSVPGTVGVPSTTILSSVRSLVLPVIR